MPEINVTSLIDTDDYSMRDFSASQFELGDNAGRITWDAAKEASEDYKFVTEENREEFTDYFRSTGGWTDEDMAEWSLEEVNALFIQFVAAAWREDFEGEQDDDRETSGSLFQCDIEGHESFGQWFYYLGT